ncbi:unnamed protein product, partial [Owenia fusiformis]
TCKCASGWRGAVPTNVHPIHVKIVEHAQPHERVLHVNVLRAGVVQHVHRINVHPIHVKIVEHAQPQERALHANARQAGEAQHVHLGLQVAVPTNVYPIHVKIVEHA